MFNNHPGTGAGKGDADRSTGWRDKYPDVNWSGIPAKLDPEFQQTKTGVSRKSYGPTPPRRTDSEPDAAP